MDHPHSGQFPGRKAPKPDLTIGYFGRWNVFTGVLQGEKLFAGPTGKMDLVLPYSHLVAGRLARIINSDHLVGFAGGFNVTVGSGDSETRNLQKWRVDEFPEGSWADRSPDNG